MDMTQLTIRLERIRSQVADEQERHKKAMEQLTEARKETHESLNQIAAGLDRRKTDLGLSVLGLRGRFTESVGEKESARQAAIRELAMRRGAEMRTRTFGVKNYDRFRGQRCDCSYGCGPSHGWITFSVGLSVRDRELTDDEIEAAIYCLYNLEAIEQARIEAANQAAEAIA